MRGKVKTWTHETLDRRITPACAGKSSRNETCWHRPWDHPCVCGEKIEMPYELLLKEGSPPRMRGKGSETQRRAIRAGITPAYAGKSLRGRIRFHREWDHPRVCGEKGLSMFWSLNHSGSPPRMRGKGNQHVNDELRLRITPACAGKRNSWAVHWTIQRDHPRVCGEKFSSRSSADLRQGSPPRMRGKEIDVPDGINVPGITPAYAGKR